ncbi:CGNR zinc finger domain-containing protein [Staphylococcus equorum]|uniref:CGNR zinc finger domain-containing protein n=1 Tax=Staphylococcus equorum TaxID=246432 RepID=UPI0009C04FB1|nr:CGNR zinc finger domain-containing protein [Staphylococcus equorum]
MKEETIIKQNFTFSYLSSYLGINFLNTLQNHYGESVDLISNNEEINNWLNFMINNQVLNKEQKEILDIDKFDLKKVYYFRDSCRQFFYQTGKDYSEEFLHTLSTKIKRAPLYFLISNGTLVPIPTKSQEDGLISLLAFDILLMQENMDIHKVKKCANDECLSFFVDKKGNKKWCSMEICGNRSKVKKHYYKNIQ